MKKLIYLTILLFFYDLSYCQVPNSLYTRNLDDLVMRAVKAENDGLYEQTIVLIDSAIAIDSAKSSYYVIKAEALCLLKKYLESALIYEKSIKVESPDYLADAYVQLGMLYEKANMFQKAKEKYLQAIDLYDRKIFGPRYMYLQKINYAVALLLSGNEGRWKQEYAKLLKDYYYIEEVKALNGKNRSEVLEIHFSYNGG
jgi:tetratricopeptide (TPR) repeat protein